MYKWTQRSFVMAMLSIAYSKSQNGIPSLDKFGLFSCNLDFSNILILISEPVGEQSKSWSGEEGLFIIAPAQNRLEAIDCAQLLSSRSNWLSHVK